MALGGTVSGHVVSEFGVRYIVDGLLAAPSGASAEFRTIWIVPLGRERPELVTAFPLRSSGGETR